MDRIVCFFLILCLLCVSCIGCKTASPIKEATPKAMAVNENDEVIIVNGPISEMAGVSAALHAAGIWYGGAGGRRAFGLYVQRKDAARARDVLLDYATDQEKNWLLIYGQLE